MIHYFSDKSMNLPLDSTGKVLLLIEKNGSNITSNMNVCFFKFQKQTIYNDKGNEF